MYTRLLTLCALALLFGFGCASKSPITLLPQVPNPFVTPTGTKTIAWCDQTNQTTTTQTEFNSQPVWIYQETFSGMTHEPTIHHVCAGSTEIFTVQMGDRKSDGSRMGYFVLPDSSQAYIFDDTSSDPTVIIRTNKKSTERDTVPFTVDDQSFTYDPTTRQIFAAKQMQ